MLEMSKKILLGVSFDKTLFKKELVKSIRWVSKEERTMLKIWCLTMFGSQYGELIQEVFNTVIA